MIFAMRHRRLYNAYAIADIYLLHNFSRNAPF